MSTGTFWLAVCEALVCAPLIGADPQEHQQAVTLAAQFLESQLAALPLLLRIGQQIGLTAFRVDVRLRFHKGFSDLDLPTRVAAVERWAGAPVAQCRQLFRALRNLALLAYYEAREEPSPQPTQQPPTASGAHTAARPASSRRVEQAGVLVIGSGAGGAVTALELAAHGYDVLLVEEGQPPGEALPNAGATDTMAHLYRHRGMTPIMGHVPIAYAEGRCVGGSTEINSGFWHRPPPETLLRWKSQYDLACATPEELRGHWEWAEAMLGVGLQNGPLPPSSDVIARGAKAMDWAVHEVPRTAAAARATGAGTPWTRGPGPGMSRSLIPKAVSAGVRLLTGCRVEKLDTNRTRVVSARLTCRLDDGSTEQICVRADYVFVCAGATETPSLLRRSGVVHNVGDSLRIHPMLKVAARFTDEIAGNRAGMPLVQVTQFSPDLVLGGSFFSAGHLAVVLADNWAVTRERMQDMGHMACYYVGVRGTGRGRVRPSRIEAGRTDIRYELSDEDMWNLSRGVARLSALLLEGGAIEVLPAVRGLPAIHTAVDAARWLDERLDRASCSLTTVHAFSSCPMGERQDRCAADSFGKLHGFENLYINDASMVPDSPGVNPQGTIMTFARRNALHFCHEHSS